MEKVKTIMAQVFGISVNQITDDASPDTIQKWDSLNHMNLVMALEEVFGIKLSADEIVSMMNYKLVCLTLRERGVI